jgi:hypothetical protein
MLNRRTRVAGRWARRRARARWFGLIRHNPIAFGVLFVIGPGVALAEQLRVHGWVGGALFGSALVTGIACVVHVATHASGSASISMGASAERWTASVLRKVERLGAWSFDNLEFYDGNVDHVLIGKGMVLAIETKWRGGGWDLSARSDHLTRVVGAARGRAERLTSLLHSKNVEAAVDARPVLLLWGGCSSKARTIDGVIAMRGEDFVDWYAATEDTADPAEEERVRGRLQAFKAEQLSAPKRKAQSKVMSKGR